MSADDKITFCPEPMAPDIPPSMRGWIQLSPEPGRPGHYRIWLRGDNAYGEPRSVLLTAADARRLHEVLGQMLQAGS